MKTLAAVLAGYLGAVENGDFDRAWKLGIRLVGLNADYARVVAEDVARMLA